MSKDRKERCDSDSIYVSVWGLFPVVQARLNRRQTDRYCSFHMDKSRERSFSRRKPGNKDVDTALHEPGRSLHHASASPPDTPCCSRCRQISATKQQNYAIAVSPCPAGIILITSTNDVIVKDVIFECFLVVFLSLCLQ